MRYFIDTEFIDDGKIIDLISIGIVAEDGRELYLQSCDFDPGKASAWVIQNVFPHLILCPHVRVYVGGETRVAPNLFAHRAQGQCTFERLMSITPTIGVPIAQPLMKPIASAGLASDMRIIGAHVDCYWRTKLQLCNELRHFITDPTEFWGWCAGYDFVALCQIFGTMMDVPQGWPHYIRDIQYLLDERGLSDDVLPKQEEGLHNALADARHVKQLWEYLQAGSDK